MTLYWDFYGPDARGTAEHFARHMDEFIAANALAGCATGVEAPTAMHAFARCTAEGSAIDALRRALRPHREE